MNKNCKFELSVSFGSCRLVHFGAEKPQEPQAEKVEVKEKEVDAADKQQELKNGIQKIEQRVSDLSKKMDECSKDADFQKFLKDRKIDLKAGLQEITVKIAEIKANLEKSDATERNKAVFTDIQKALEPLEKTVTDADELKAFNERMKVKFKEDEKERAAAFKEARAEKAENTAEIGKEFKLKGSTNLFDNIGKKEGRIVGVLDGNTMVKIIDQRMMSIVTRGSLADSTGFDNGSVHPWVKVEGKFKTGVDGKGSEKTYKGWIPWELIKPEAGKVELKPEPADKPGTEVQKPGDKKPEDKKPNNDQPDKDKPNEQKPESPKGLKKYAELFLNPADAARTDEMLEKMDPITISHLGVQWVNENQATAMRNILGEEYLKHVYVVKGAKFPSDVLDKRAEVAGSKGYIMRKLLMKRQEELLKKKDRV